MKKGRLAKMGLVVFAAILVTTMTLGSAVFACTEGFTPGFWKNHTEDWVATGYAPGDSFDAVFGVDSTKHLTLLEALKEGGGGEDALGRHAVAALLNAAHPDIWGPDEGYVLWAVWYAYEWVGEFPTMFETLKDEFEGYNELPEPW